MTVFDKISCQSKNKKPKKIFVDIQFHNILRIFDVLPNFYLTARETMGDY